MLANSCALLGNIIFVKKNVLYFVDGTELGLVYSKPNNSLVHKTPKRHTALPPIPTLSTKSLPSPTNAHIISSLTTETVIEVGFLIP